MNIFGDTGLNTIQGWLGGISGRREAVAQNIANIDTPGYHRKEVSFEAELKRSMGGSRTLAATDAQHFRNGASSPGGPAASNIEELVSPRRDGNSVDIDHEMIVLSETQMHYTAATTALNKKLASIREALRSY